MTSANSNFDQILSTTLNAHRPTLTDNVFKSNPLSDRLLRAGQRREESGGVKIVEPLIHAENDTVMAYSEWDRLDLTPQDGISAAEYNWKMFAGSVAISGYQESVNNGDRAIINLLKAKTMQLEKTLGRSLNRQLNGNYTGLTQANSFAAIGDYIDSTGTIGNIDPSTYTWWKSIEIDASGDTYWTESHWGTAVYTSSDGIDGPKFATTTAAILQAYEEGLMPALRFTSNNEADSRFNNLTFKGMPVFSDPDCATGVTYFVNEDNFSLVTHSDRWMKNLGFRETPDVDGKWALVVSQGNLTCRSRRGSAKVTGQTHLTQAP